MVGDDDDNCGVDYVGVCDVLLLLVVMYAMVDVMVGAT